MKNEWVINHHDVIAMRDSAEYIMTMTYEENQAIKPIYNSVSQKFSNDPTYNSAIIIHTSIRICYDFMKILSIKLITKIWEQQTN